jgi:hypothetical protein
MPEISDLSSWASSSLSSSWASHSFSSTTASWASHSFSATSASWASKSISASHAQTALTSSIVILDSTVYDENTGSGYLVMWNPSGPYSRSINSTLTNTRQVFVSNRQLWCGWPDGPTSPNYSASIYDGVQWAGFLTNGSIIGDIFVGQDHKEWDIVTGSTYPSGSYTLSSNPANWMTIPNTTSGLSESVDGKWIRIAASDSCSYSQPMGGYGIKGLNGRVSFRFTTDTLGSNVDETIDLEIHGNIAQPQFMNVFVSNGQRYNGGLVETIRIGHGWSSGSILRVDPGYYIDVKIRGLVDNDTYIYFKGFSHAGSAIRILPTPTIDVPDPMPSVGVSWIPWINVNPKVVGFYSNQVTSSLDSENRYFYAFQGKRVGIGPPDYWKSSYDRVPQYDLDVSGSINASSYCVSTSSVGPALIGKSANDVRVTIGGVTKYLTFTNGILTNIL